MNTMLSLVSCLYIGRSVGQVFHAYESGMKSVGFENNIMFEM